MLANLLHSDFFTPVSRSPVPMGNVTAMTAAAIAATKTTAEFAQRGDGVKKSLCSRFASIVAWCSTPGNSPSGLMRRSAAASAVEPTSTCLPASAEASALLLFTVPSVVVKRSVCSSMSSSSGSAGVGRSFSRRSSRMRPGSDA